MVYGHRLSTGTARSADRRWMDHAQADPRGRCVRDRRAGVDHPLTRWIDGERGWTPRRAGMYFESMRIRGTGFTGAELNQTQARSRMAKSRQWRFVGVVVALLVVLLGAGWLVRDRFLPVEVGSRAPGFIATDLEGRPVSLDDLKGQVVLLNVWATWCGPCRDEMPSMERLHRELGPQGLRIVAVSVDAAPGAATAPNQAGGDVDAFARQLGLTFTIWHDPSGGIQRTYRTTGVPESFIIDRNGVIQKKVIGATEWDSGPHVELLRRLLEERAG